MVALSAVLHVAVVIAVVFMVGYSQSRPAPPIAYTVELVDPAALGTSIPSGTSKAAQPTPPAVGEKQPTSKPQPTPREQAPPAVKKEKVAPPSSAQKQITLPKKDKPAEKKTVKQKKKKTEPKEKKPEMRKAAAKPESHQAQDRPEEKKPEPTKLATLSPEERDQRIRAALERIKTQVSAEEKRKSAPVSRGSGPLTLGGAPGEGGGGVVRGLEFIMYTEQVKRRVKESWIVAEKKPGLTAIVRFGVQPDGEVFDVELLQSSGNSTFDQSTLRAVRRASPLPPPPHTYQHEFAIQKVEVSFGGEERAN